MIISHGTCQTVIATSPPNILINSCSFQERKKKKLCFLLLSSLYVYFLRNKLFIYLKIKSQWLIVKISWLLHVIVRLISNKKKMWNILLLFFLNSKTILSFNLLFSNVFCGWKTKRHIVFICLFIWFLLEKK